MWLASIIYPRIDPVALRLGPLSIKWYGIAYLLGFAVAYAVLRKLIRRGAIRITGDNFLDLFSWLVAGVMIGGRGGWWLFYHRHSGAMEPWYEPFAIWHGGMSFHGGLIGVAFALGVWSWLWNAPTWNLADGIALVAPIGLFLGRIANFINAELVGRPTRVTWGVIFPGENFARHPSQLYEALLEGPILMLAVWCFARFSRRCEGQVAAVFLILYGVFRFAVEFTRQPDEQLGYIALHWLTMGQLLSIGLVLFGCVLWPMARHRLTQPANPASES